MNYINEKAHKMMQWREKIKYVKDKNPALYNAVMSGDTEEVRSIVEREKSYTYNTMCWIDLFPVVIKNGDLAMCKLFLSHGASIYNRDEGLNTPLLIAVKMWNLEMCKLLLSGGGVGAINVRDGFHQLPVHIAAKNGDTKICKLLLEHTSRISKEEHDETCRLLFEHMVAVNGRGKASADTTQEPEHNEEPEHTAEIMGESL